MTKTANKNGFLRTAFYAFIASRERQAQRYVNNVLLSLRTTRR